MGDLTNSGTFTTVAGSAEASRNLGNTGTITGSAVAGGSLTNSGTINGGATAGTMLTNSGGIGGNVIASNGLLDNQAGGTINGATITATTGNVLNNGTISGAAALTITAGGNITQNNILTAGANAVNLNAGGTISGSAGVVGTTLTVRGFGGGVTRAESLNLTTGNAITTLDALTSLRFQPLFVRMNSVSLTFAQANSLVIAQADAGINGVALGSNGIISGGGVVGTFLTVRGAGLAATRAASLNLTTRNAIGTLDALVDNAALAFGQVGGLSIAQANAGTGAVTLLSNGAITGAGGVTGSSLTVRGSNGVAGAGSLNLAAGNANTTLDALVINNTLTFGQTGALQIARANAGTGAVTLLSNGAITGTGGVTGSSLTVRGANGTATASSLYLTTGNSVGTLNALVSGGLTFTSAGTLTVAQASSSGGAVSLVGDGLIVTGNVASPLTVALQAVNGSIALQSGMSVSAGTTAQLTATYSVIQSGGTLNAGGALILTAGGDALQTGGTTTAASLSSATQGSSAGRDFLWNGGAVTLPSIFAVNAGRDLALRVTSGSTTVQRGMTAGRDLSVQSLNGTLTMAAIALSAGTGNLLLEAATGMSATGTSINAGNNLSAYGTSGSMLFQSVSARAAAGNLLLQSGGNLSILSSTLIAGQNVTTTAAGSITSNPSVLTAGADLILTARGDLSFTQGTLTATQNFTAQAGGNASFQSSTLRAHPAPAGNSGAWRTLRVSATGRLSLVSSIVSADRAEFVAGGSMTTGGTAFTIGTGLLLSARGGIGQSGEATTRVTAIDPGRLPLTFFDTRSGAFLSHLPDALTSANSDRPGLAFGDQAWQVAGGIASPGQLLFGVNDGASAAPSNASAGPIFVNLNTGSAPVFMLLNGGTATGTLTAGRLGLYGRPGSSVLASGRAVDLTGSLSQLGGAEAARFGELGATPGSQPAAAELELYRFNNCVVSSVNCVVPTFFQLPTVPILNTFVIANQQLGLDDSDVFLPNVAERDF